MILSEISLILQESMLALIKADSDGILVALQILTSCKEGCASLL